MPASQDFCLRAAAYTSWRSPVWASAPLGLRRGARANPVGVVVAALVVVAHSSPRARLVRATLEVSPPASALSAYSAVLISL